MHIHENDMSLTQFDILHQQSLSRPAQLSSDGSTMVHSCGNIKGEPPNFGQLP